MDKLNTGKIRLGGLETWTYIECGRTIVVRATDGQGFLFIFFTYSAGHMIKWEKNVPCLPSQSQCTINMRTGNVQSNSLSSSPYQMTTAAT